MRSGLIQNRTADRRQRRARVISLERGCVEDQPQQQRLHKAPGKLETAYCLDASAAGAPRAHTQPRSGGFTLIEMMVVIAIIATILMAAFPSMYSFVHKEGFRRTVSDVLESCRSARAEAIMHDTTATLVFHPHDGTCDASSEGSGHGVWAHSAKFEHCTIEMLDVNLREYKDAPVATVRFFPNGTSDEMTLVLHSDKGEYRTISLEITTGLVTVSTGLPKG